MAERIDQHAVASAMGLIGGFPLGVGAGGDRTGVEAVHVGDL